MRNTNFMRVVKLYTNRSTTPKFFVFVREDTERKRFLVTYPTYKPDRFREAKWFDFDEVRVEWIREYLEESIA